MASVKASLINIAAQNAGRMKWMNIGEKVTLTASMAVSRLINASRRPARMSYKNILCIRLDEIGDMIYSLHVFELLHKKYPDADITLLCKPFVRTLLHSDPNVTHISTSWKELKGGYDLIVDLRCSWKSIFYSLKSWPATRLDRGTVRFFDSTAGRYPHEVETNFKVIEPLGIVPMMQPHLSLNDDDRNVADAFIAGNSIIDFALLHISARRELRKWPQKQFAELAKWLHNEKKLQVVFIGDASETNDIEEIRKMIPFDTCSTAGILSLTALAALMEKATLYIGNESGPLHMAAVLNIPSLGLYGPGPQHIFYPHGKKTAVIHPVLECNPCDQIHCVHPEQPCITRITLNDVKEKVNLLLSQETVQFQ